MRRFRGSRFAEQQGRRYIVGTPKSMLKKFEQHVLSADWHKIREVLEVKLCVVPHDADDGEGDEDDSQATECKDDATQGPPVDAAEIFILCRSQDRWQKEEAILRRFEQKIEARLKSMSERCAKQKRQPLTVAQEVGRLLGQNTRAAKLFEVTVETTEEGHARLKWKKLDNRRDWATLSAGCYLLRTNVRDWSDEELWKTYIQLTEAEAAFRIHKSDLSLRPIWHQKEDRVLAHILVCFLAYVLWKTLGQLCHSAGLGDEPRRVLSELSEIRLMDVILPTRGGDEIRKRYIARPSDHQQILLDKLRLTLPEKINQIQM